MAYHPLFLFLSLEIQLMIFFNIIEMFCNFANSPFRLFANLAYEQQASLCHGMHVGSATLEWFQT